MSSATAKSGEWMAGLTAGCDRLVHPTAASPTEHARQRRLIGVALAAPFLAAAALAQLLAGLLPIATILALLCAVFAGGWSVALLVAATGRRRAAERLALVFAVPTLAGILVAAGGPGSPVLLLAVAAAIEARWIARTREATIAGAASGLIAVVLAASVLNFVLPGLDPAFGVWQWLAPAAYLALVWMRRDDLLADSSATETTIESQPVVRQLEAAVLRLDADGEVVETSRHCAECFGVRPDMLQGRPLLERVHVADRVAYMCALAEVRAGEGPKRLELRFRLPAGGASWPADGYRAFDVELIGEGGAEAPVFVVARDNTSVEALRGELADSREEVASGEVAKNRFLAAVSHELRTPLNTIIGFSDMLLQEVGGPIGAARRREYVGLIRESGHHLLSVVNAILDVSKIEAGAYCVHPEPFDLAEAVELCRSMMAPQANAKPVVLTASVAPDVGEVVGDRRAVQQILFNLMSNALKFTPAEGRVAVEARRSGSNIVLEVSDTGIGISADDLDRLGEPFVQIQNDLTRQFEGTGLGLALVKGLVRLHHGEMSIESEPGAGTTVRLVLPADDAVARIEDAARAPRTDQPASGEPDETIRRSA